jgi:hypothetical protein
MINLSKSINSDYKHRKKEASKQARYLTQLMLEGKSEELEVEVKKYSNTRKSNEKTNVKRLGRTPEELFSRDFCDADQFPYRTSPSSGGNRPKNELLGGTGSNMYRKR